MTRAADWFRHKIKWKYDRIYSMQSFEVPDIKWIERYVVGTTHPEKALSQKEIDRQLQTVNRALRYGKLVAIEQNITTMSNADKNIITQYTVYHVGFKHRPPGK